MRSGEEVWSGSGEVLRLCLISGGFWVWKKGFKSQVICGRVRSGLQTRVRCYTRHWSSQQCELRVPAESKASGRRVLPCEVLFPLCARFSAGFGHMWAWGVCASMIEQVLTGLPGPCPTLQLWTYRHPARLAWEWPGSCSSAYKQAVRAEQLGSLPYHCLWRREVLQPSSWQVWIFFQNWIASKQRSQSHVGPNSCGELHSKLHQKPTSLWKVPDIDTEASSGTSLRSLPGTLKSLGPRHFQRFCLNIELLLGAFGPFSGTFIWNLGTVYLEPFDLCVWNLYLEPLCGTFIWNFWTFASVLYLGPLKLHAEPSGTWFQVSGRLTQTTLLAKIPSFSNSNAIWEKHEFRTNRTVIQACLCLILPRTIRLKHRGFLISGSRRIYTQTETQEEKRIQIETSKHELAEAACCWGGPCHLQQQQDHFEQQNHFESLKVFARNVCNIEECAVDSNEYDFTIGEENTCACMHMWHLNQFWTFGNCPSCWLSPSINIWC